MGSIIREDTEGEPSAALTETGKGGLLSTGYLREEPAREYVGAGETPVFVLTDDEGIERERDGDRSTIAPGSGYRAITVVTDRRVIVLVGNAGDDGDRRLTLPLVEITAVRTDEGRLVVEMTSGVTWRCRADDAGLEDVAEYVRDAAETWRDVESTLDDVKRSIVEATGHRDAGEYDAALEAMRDARDDIEAVQERTASFDEDWQGDAMVDRVEQVRDRCLATAAEIRVGYARATIDEGEEHWREGAYERARDAFEDAREAFEAVQSLAPRHRETVDDVDRELERLERSIERLDDAPLRNAIDADRRAKEAEPSLEALDALAEARERYEVVLELDPDGDRRRFAGDRDRIREQREDVTDRFVETALDVGTDALEAGEWYSGTGKEDLALEEFERAVEALDRGLDVAREERPGAAEDLRKKRSTATDGLDELASERNERRPDDGHVDDSRTGDSNPGDGRADRSRADGGDMDDAGGETSPGSPGPVADGAAADGGRARDVDENSVTTPPREAGNAGVESAEESPGLERSTEPAGIDRSTEPADVEAAGSSGGVEPGNDSSAVGANGGNGELEETLRALSPAEFGRVVATVVEAMGWRPEETASSACDYIATREDEPGTLAVRAFPNEGGEPITPETVRECGTLATSVPSVEDVVLVTTRPLSDAARAAARSRDVRVLDVEYLADVLGGPGAGDGTLAPTAGD